VADRHVLLDTNVLVYLYDISTPDKQSQAIATLRRLEEHSAGAVRTQVLSEFFSAATLRLRPLCQSKQRFPNWSITCTSGLFSR